MCNHQFTKWTYVNYNEGHYDYEEWYQRICAKCGYIEEIDLDEYEEKQRKEK